MPVKLVRWVVTVIMLIYALAKIIGPQFHYGWETVTYRRGDPLLFKMIFDFYGYSRVYGTFIGFAELIPAILLQTRRFATVGAAGIFAIMLNVSVMDVAFGIPLGATIVAIGLVVASGYLLWVDRRKLAPLVA